jgi:hypothetical protein
VVASPVSRQITHSTAPSSAAGAKARLRARAWTSGARAKGSGQDMAAA